MKTESTHNPWTADGKICVYMNEIHLTTALTAATTTTSESINHLHRQKCKSLQIKTKTRRRYK